MTLYEFSNNYLTEQTKKFLPDFPLKELDYYRIPHIYAWPPYFNAQPDNIQKSDLMKMLAFILQNRFNLPNVINFEKNYEIFCKITNYFDPATLAAYTQDEFTRLLFNELGSPVFSSSWKNYIQGLFDAANYLNRIDTFDYNSYLKRANENPNEIMGELCKIRGIGPALARNFLKEIGATQFGKPDVHLYKVFEFDPTVVDEVTFDIALTTQARKSNVSPFELDRIIWLICSGKYFKHHIKIKRKNLRDKYINTLKELIDKGLLII